uniref:Putative secreted protein n=1 Tax=Anopheles marajoara TaxID=58244 RepID=A0A2M4CEE4_9DIPT
MPPIVSCLLLWGRFSPFSLSPATTSHHFRSTPHTLRTTTIYSFFYRLTGTFCLGEWRKLKGGRTNRRTAG